MKFDYKIVEFDSETSRHGGEFMIDKIEMQIKKLGAEGWDLQSAIPVMQAFPNIMSEGTSTQKVIMIFKRIL